MTQFLVGRVRHVTAADETLLDRLFRRQMTQNSLVRNEQIRRCAVQIKNYLLDKRRARS